MKRAVILTIFLLVGCGYKPSSYLSSKIVGQRVHTEVDVSLSDPENAVMLKDALNRALYSRIKTVVTDRSSADSSIKVSYKSIDFMPLQYDKNGYVVYYQALIHLKFEFIKGNILEEKNIVGRYEFPIRPSAIISTSLRFKAIERGSKRALDEFIAYLETRGVVFSG